MSGNWRNVEASEGLTSDDVNPGPAPMLQWIKIASLVIDDSYQRPLERKNWNAIRKIAMSFQWSRFSPVFVAPVEGGRYAIIDGQHRTHAAAACGFEQVPCQVVQMDLKEQAAAFAAVNGNVTQVTIWQIYKAALAAGEEWATKARDVADSAGCHLMTRNGSSLTKKPGEIYGVRMFCEIVDKYPQHTVVQALQAAMKTEGLGDTAEAWNTVTIKPILHALCQRPKAMAKPGFEDRFAELDFWALEDQIAQENRRRARAGSPPLAKGDQMEAGILEWIDKAFPERVALPGQAA